jgi:hypothetical protein
MLKINCNVVLKDMIEKAEQAGGDTFYRFNAVTANCQRFISVLMNSSGITGTDAFVMQDATQLIKNSGLRRVAGAIADVAALGERAILGHGRNQPQKDLIQRRNQLWNKLTQ